MHSFMPFHASTQTSVHPYIRWCIQLYSLPYIHSSHTKSYLYPAIHISLYIHLPIYPSIYISISLYCPSIYISIYLHIYIYIYISIYLYIRLSSYSSIWLLAIRPSVCMCVGMHCISFGHQPKQLGKKHKINVTQTENGRECSGQKCSFHPYIDETCDKIPQIQIITLDNEALGWERGT